MRRWNGLSRDFNKLYARDGRPSIPPERLLRALLLQAFYTVRSERQLMGATQLQSIVPVVSSGSRADDQVWNATVFCKETGIGCSTAISRPKFFVSVFEPAPSPQAALRRALLGRWHPDRGLGQHEELLCRRTAGDPPIGEKVMVAVGANAERNFHGEKRRNDTHFSTTDPDARLFPQRCRPRRPNSATWGI